jgi:hypothetical protein
MELALGFGMQRRRPLPGKIHILNDLKHTGLTLTFVPWINLKDHVSLEFNPRLAIIWIPELNCASVLKLVNVDGLNDGRESEVLNIHHAYLKHMLHITLAICRTVALVVGFVGSRKARRLQCHDSGARADEPFILLRLKGTESLEATALRH